MKIDNKLNNVSFTSVLENCLELTKKPSAVWLGLGTHSERVWVHSQGTGTPLQRASSSVTLSVFASRNSFSCMDQRQTSRCAFGQRRDFG